MVHTFNICSQINYILFKDLIRTGKLKKHKYNYFTTEAFRKEGINQIRIYEVNKDGYRGYWMVAKVNFPKITMDCEFTDKLKADAIKLAEDRFNSLIRELHPHIPEFRLWKVKRIDYSIDIKTPYIKEYIKLFQKGRVPNPFKIPIDDNNHRNHKVGSLYLKAESVKVNFYDKQNELINNGYADENLIQLAKDTLRLEVQCEDGKVNSIKNKFKLRTKSIIDFLNENISSQIISDYYIKTVGAGNFYSLKKAKQIIDDSDLKDKKKIEYKDLLTNIAKARSVENYLNKLPTQKERTKAINLIEQMKIKLIINPITIPREWGIDTLPGIIPQIGNYYINFKTARNPFILNRMKNTFIVNKGDNIEIS